MNAMKNIIIRYSLIIGIILSMFGILSIMFLTPQSDLSTLEFIGNTVMFLTIGIVMFFGIKQYRDIEAGGKITYGNVLIKGILATLIGSVLYSLTFTVYSTLNEVKYADIIMEMTVLEMQEEGLSDEEISLIIEKFEDFRPYYEMPIVKFFITVLEPLFPGLLASLILGFILKRK